MESSWVVLFLTCLIFRGTVSWSEQDQQELDDFVENTFLPSNSIPGLILTVIQNETLVLAKGYGYKNMQAGLPADSDTLMSIGSITKSFVGTIVAKTLHEIFPELGSEVLEVPVQTLFPNANITFSDRYRAESMSFRDLLSHRSCLSSPDMDLIFNTIPSIAEKKYRTRYQTETCRFRTGFVYNNALYGLAGDLIGDLKGVPFTELLVDFMEEIGMEGATFIDGDGQFENLDHLSSAYYLKDNETHLFNPKLLGRVSNMVAAGGILASAKNMGAYVKFHLNKGKVGDRQVIPEHVFPWIYQIANGAVSAFVGRVPPTSDLVVGTYGYSLGFTHQILDGFVQMSHAGYWPPFLSDLQIFPDLKHGIFIATNGPGGAIGWQSGLSQAHLSYKILSLLEDVTPLPPPSLTFQRKLNFDLKGSQATLNLKSEFPNRITRASNLNGIDDLIGLYGHPVNGDLIIGFDPEDSNNQTMEMRYGEFGIGRLRPLESEPLKYAIEWKTDITHNFYADCASYDCIIAEDELNFSYEDAVVIGPLIFIKDANLESFPPIPWSPESCGPISPS